jgi:ubiquinone/menaquinone biosynthesis C-methylase UbiE
MTDWDATRYHRVSEPQFDWGQRVIARLQPSAGERILDLGCGTGRLTREIIKAAGDGPPVRVIGLDRSGSMLAVARADAAGFASPIGYVQADGATLPFANAFDAVFSAATLHWIHDHPAVFRSVNTALVPNGRFVAQCGGKRNLQHMLEHAGALMASAPYREHLSAWRDPWNFADAATTSARLKAAGLTRIETWLEEAPVDLETAEKYAEFVSCVCIRHHLDRLPPDLRGPFTADLTERAGSDDPPFTLDYWRLNIDARKPAA